MPREGKRWDEPLHLYQNKKTHVFSIEDMGFKFLSVWAGTNLPINLKPQIAQTTQIKD